jgi:hypothetical protein
MILIPFYDVLRVSANQMSCVTCTCLSLTQGLVEAKSFGNRVEFMKSVLGSDSLNHVNIRHLHFR